MFIAFLYMFRATMCPSSGENTVPIQHLVLVTLYRWLSGMQGRMKHADKSNKRIKKICAPSWFFLQDSHGRSHNTAPLWQCPFSCTTISPTCCHVQKLRHYNSVHWRWEAAVQEANSIAGNETFYSLNIVYFYPQLPNTSEDNFR